MRTGERQLEILVADIGGTNARLAIASANKDQSIGLADERHYSVDDFDNFDQCLAEYRGSRTGKLPARALFAVAAPTEPDEIIFTNSPWRFSQSTIERKFSFRHVSCINDFEAVAHAAAMANSDQLQPILEPLERIQKDQDSGVTMVLGPGTGLGVSYIVGKQTGYHIQKTEAAHIGFSPSDEVEDLLHINLRRKFGRVSAERLTSGNGLNQIYSLLAERITGQHQEFSDKDVWNKCLSCENDLAVAAMNRYCRIFGAVAGDLALAQGASRVILAGGITKKLSTFLRDGNFQSGFIEKGRFKNMMQNIQLEVLAIEQPGLTGAALRFFSDRDLVRTT